MNYGSTNAPQWGSMQLDESAVLNRGGERPEAIEDTYPGHRDNEVVGEDMPELAADRSSNTIREFSVRQLNYGYIITVGCHQFAIESHEKATKLIGEYLANPNEVESKWFANEFTIKKHV